MIFPVTQQKTPPEELVSVELTWRDGELIAGNGLIQRRWNFVDGLPVPMSLIAYGREWLKPDGKPGMVPPGSLLQPPLNIHWDTETDPGDPVEAPSRRGTLTVVDQGGSGYRWHLQVFADCPAITCRIERMDKGESEPPEMENSPTAVGATGVESDEVERGETLDRDLMERLPLAAMHAQLAVVELVDSTDHFDNLVFKRVWRLGPKEKINAVTCLAAIEDTLSGAGLILLKHAPLPKVRPVQSLVDMVGEDRLVKLLGHGAGPEGQGYAWSVIAWEGGRWERSAALHRLQQRFRPFKPGRDGLLLSNTWGDRNRDSRIAEAFVLTEIAAGAGLGVEVCQVDDGWQKGVSANSANAEKGVWTGFWEADPNFWTPNPQRFPNGLAPVVTAAMASGLAMGLWFAPDSSNHFANWEKDAAVVVGLYRQHGIRFIKIDGVKTTSKEGELNLQRFFKRVRVETDGEVTIDLDVTAEVRPGYFGAIQAGPIFLENRYTDWGQWWPHATLRNLWQLSWHVPPQRLRIEFLNPQRNLHMYEDSPLAPSRYPADYPFATTLLANPLAWFEVSNLPKEISEPISALAAVWRLHRDELHAGTTLPVGDCPSGAAWTGFCSRGPETVHVFIFRELTLSSERELELPIPPGNWDVERIAGSGDAVWRGGHLHVNLPEALHWIWVRLRMRDEEVLDQQ